MTNQSSNIVDNIHYTRQGTGPVMVLIHGFPDNGAIWDGVAQALSATYTLIIPDLPGAGKSPLHGAVMLPEMAAGIKAILDHERVTQAVFVGHSMGGYAALAFAGLFPDMVAGLSLVHSVPTADDDEKVTSRLKAIELILKGGKEPFLRQMTTNLFAPDFKDNHPAAVQAKLEMGMEVSEEALVNFYRAMIARADTTGVVSKAQFPMQWVIGQQDNIIPYKKILKECHAANLNSVTLYTNSGHISMIEEPAQLITDLRDFGNFCYSYYP